MSTLDIRTQSNEPVDTIIVADTDPNSYNVEHICKRDGLVVIEDKSSSDVLTITSDQHARDIIKGIEKAIELDWFKE